MNADFLNQPPPEYAEGMVISRNLIALMASKGMTQEQLAEAAGVSQSTVSRWIKGQTSPSKKHMAAIRAVIEQMEGRQMAQDLNAVAQAAAKLGDKPLNAETMKLLTDFVDKFLTGYHPAAGQLWREAVQSQNPFPEDIPFSEENRDRLLEEAEFQGRRAQLRTKR